VAIPEMTDTLPLGLPEAKWEERGKDQEQEATHDLDVKQSTLSDFLD